jgi:hypothetical protein
MLLFPKIFEAKTLYSYCETHVMDKLNELVKSYVKNKPLG